MISEKYGKVGKYFLNSHINCEWNNFIPLKVGDKVGEEEKEKIFDDVLDAMTEDRSTKDTAEVPKTDDNKPMEETPSEVKGNVKSDTASEVKDTAIKDDVTSEVKATAVKDDATSAAKDDEMTGG